MVAVVYKEGKQWVSQCLNVDIASCGTTHTRAIRNLTEAVKLYFDEPRRPSLRRVEKRHVFVQEIQHA